jgi:hypothetical protein
MSQNSIFVDGFDNITLVDGVVRFDLITVAQTAANTPPTPSKVGSMAMSIQGFLRSADQLNQVINKMVEQGILKRNDPAAAAPAPAPAPAPAIAAPSASNAKTTKA